MAQVAMQLECQEGKMDNISVMVSNPDSNNGLDFNINPVNDQVIKKKNYKKYFFFVGPTSSGSYPGYVHRTCSDHP